MYNNTVPYQIKITIDGLKNLVFNRDNLINSIKNINSLNDISELTLIDNKAETLLWIDANASISSREACIPNIIDSIAIAIHKFVRSIDFKHIYMLTVSIKPIEPFVGIFDSRILDSMVDPYFD